MGASLRHLRRPGGVGAVILGGEIVQQWVLPTHVIARRQVSVICSNILRQHCIPHSQLSRPQPRGYSCKPTHQGTFLHTAGSNAVTPDLRQLVPMRRRQVMDACSCLPATQIAQNCISCTRQPPTPKTIPDPHPDRNPTASCLCQVPQWTITVSTSPTAVRFNFRIVGRPFHHLHRHLHHHLHRHFNHSSQCNHDNHENHDNDSNNDNHCDHDNNYDDAQFGLHHYH